MITQLPVRLPTDGPAAKIAPEVLASLPLSYAVAGPDATNTVAVLDGDEDWPEAARAAARSGAAGLIVIDPLPVDPARVEDLRDLGAAVVVDSRWASNPAIEPTAGHLRAALVPGARLECRAVVATNEDVDRALLAQLLLISRAAHSVSGLAVRYRDEHGYLADGRAGDVSVGLTLTRTDALPAHATIRILTADGGVELRFPSAENALPAAVHVVGPEGDLQLPTLYESSHRWSWRRLHAIVTAGDGSSDLDILTADLATARAAGSPFTS